MFGGIVFITSPNTTKALVAARYLNGIAVGLVMAPFLMHISEISRFKTRGACLGLEQLSLTFGMAMQMIIVAHWDPTSQFSANSLHGIIDILLAVFTFLSLIYFIESPVDYLRMGNEASALGSLAHLQRPPRVNSVTNILLLEHNTYVREHEHLPWTSGLGPLMKMSFCRSAILAFTFSYPLSVILKHSMKVNVTFWPPIFAACLRLCGGFLSLMVIDKIGRKLVAFVASLITGSLVVTIAVICNNSLNLNNVHKMVWIFVIYMILQFFAGFYAPVTSAYMGEAFPLKRKAHYMTLCIVLEQIVQILVLCFAADYGNDGTFMAEGIIIVVTGVCLSLTMPETKDVSLREAQKRFRRFFDFKMF